MAFETELNMLWMESMKDACVWPEKQEELMFFPRIAEMLRCFHLGIADRGGVPAEAGYSEGTGRFHWDTFMISLT